MKTPWVTTSAALPHDGSVVEFLLDGRECPLSGKFVLGRFETRWAHYDPETVSEWRERAPGEIATVLDDSLH